MLKMLCRSLLITILALISQTVMPSLSLAAAGNFGTSCSLPTIAGDTTDLGNQAYGMILQNLKMPCTTLPPCTSGHTPCCSAASNCQDNQPTNITLCVRKNFTPPSTPPTTCDFVTVTVGRTVSVNLNNINISFRNQNTATGPEIVQVQAISLPNSNQVCLVMPTPYGQSTPLMCKSTNISQPQSPNGAPPPCAPLSPACYGTSFHSQSPFNFSGNAYECLVGSLNNIFFRTNSCGQISSDPDANLLASFPSFQETLKAGIGAAMIMYIMFFGIRLSLGAEKLSLDKIAMTVIKLVVVTYFAIGLTLPQYINQHFVTRDTGSTDIILPLAQQALTGFAQIIFNSAGSNTLCAFDQTLYADGYNYYSLWDAIDCRLGYYLGMPFLSTSIPHGTIASQFVNPGFNEIHFPPAQGYIVDLGFDNATFFGYFWVLWGLLLGGNIVMVIFSMVFLLIFLGIVMQFISTVLVCVITIYVMIYVSPVFITFSLFDRTKGYFDSWLKIVVSCSLQPAVLAGFLALVMTAFDNGMYDTCKFNRYTYTVPTSPNTVPSWNISTFIIAAPATESPLTGDCVSSPGFKMMRYYQGQGWDSTSLLLITIYYIDSVTDQFLNIIDLTVVCLLCVIFYFFSKSMGSFASDLTGGPNMDSVTVSASSVVGKIIDGAKSAANKAINAAKQAVSKGTAGKGEGGGGGNDQGTKGRGGGASDSASGGGGGGKASDSAGGGGGGALKKLASAAAKAKGG